jgi:FlaA1/EpsC-like NDP-sugar epimerase
MNDLIKNKIILIFGGTGSLGYALNLRYIQDNIIYNVSRDEYKQWKMNIEFNNHPNMKYIIANVSNKERTKELIMRINPHIIIIASAMKHIEKCEVNINECLNTNLLGTKNILDSIEESRAQLSNLETVLFVSTDKACSPVNSYGMCKALSENMMIEKAHYIKEIKFVNVRYGNVLNSNGSIIQSLHLIGNDPKYQHFSLTNENMTRFIMTMDDSVKLIEYALLNGSSGDTIIPELQSISIKDMLELFSTKYNKPVIICGLRNGEKLMESLINETQSGRIKKTNKYIHIKSSLEYKDIIDPETLQDYNSTLNPISKDQLCAYLQELQLL